MTVINEIQKLRSRMFEDDLFMVEIGLAGA